VRSPYAALGDGGDGFARQAEINAVSREVPAVLRQDAVLRREHNLLPGRQRLSHRRPRAPAGGRRIPARSRRLMKSAVSACFRPIRCRIACDAVSGGEADCAGLQPLFHQLGQGVKGAADDEQNMPGVDGAPRRLAICAAIA
jgi:hypothetical protein